MTGQARQSGVRALEFDLAVKENAELKEKLEKANQEILALKNVKGKNCSHIHDVLFGELLQKTHECFNIHITSYLKCIIYYFILLLST